MYTIEQLREIIKAELDKQEYVEEPYSLFEPIKYIMEDGGKRLRPVLTLMAYNLYRDDIGKALKSAIGIEIFHNYTLLHDDVMDDAELRRGRQTVHKKWNDNTAILSGDSMLVLAFQRMMQCDAKHLKDILDLFTVTALEIGEGQQYDMEFETRNDVKEEEYIEMIRLKTSVLLACALKIGAILADASAEDADNLYKFGEQIGLAFQLQDDYLDVYGDSKVFGKEIGGDITSNKKTYMLINAFNKANDAQRKELTRWVSARDFDRNEKVDAVTRLYNEIGIDQLAQDKIAYYFAQSKKFLDAVNVPEEKKEELRKYAQKMMKRQY